MVSCSAAVHLQRKEREKEQQFLEKSAEILRHRKEAIADKELGQQEQARQEHELLEQRVLQDQKVGCRADSSQAEVTRVRSPLPPVPCPAVGTTAASSQGSQRDAGIPQEADGRGGGAQGG